MKYFWTLFILLFSSSSFAALSGKWQLIYDYGCDGGEKIATYQFESNNTWKSITSSSSGIYATEDDMLILQFNSSKTHPTVYAGNQENLTRYTGIMRNWNGNTGCFELDKVGNLD